VQGLTVPAAQLGWAIVGGDEYSRRTLDFVARLQRLTDYDEICDLIVRELEWFGLTHVTSISLPGPGRDPTILMNNRPQEYVDHYIEKNYLLRDPVVTELRNTLNPYTWGDVRARRDLSKAEQAIIDEAREFDARDGFVIPIAAPSGSVSLFSACGWEPNLSERARAALEIIGIYSQHALKRAVMRAQREDASIALLTPRELEVLKRCKDGKTRPQIGEILSISPKTVEFHLRSIMDKLGASNQISAVVIALQRGLLEL
jgi:LuxR family quorum sensing-dependent transcriptional regulator